MPKDKNSYSEGKTTQYPADFTGSTKQGDLSPVSESNLSRYKKEAWCSKTISQGSFNEDMPVRATKMSNLDLRNVDKFTQFQQF
tara:strand:+ start:147 stop:398 length:252 start_codon:yes stop_codon:yes gene_type:complete